MTKAFKGQVLSLNELYIENFELMLKQTNKQEINIAVTKAFKGQIIHLKELDIGNFEFVLKQTNTK